MRHRCGLQDVSIRGRLLFFGLTWAVFVQGNPGQNVDVSIVIIGAGAAGLSAGQRLHEFGFTNVVILEAENRTGGRVYGSGQPGIDFVELGGEKIHGDGHVLYELAKASNLLSPDRGYSRNGWLADFEHPEELSKDYLLEFKTGMDRFGTFMDDIMETDATSHKSSVQTAIGHLYGHNEDMAFPGPHKAAVDYKIRASMSRTGSPSPKYLSVRGYTDRVLRVPDSILQNGVSMLDVLNLMTGTYPREWLNLGMRVDGISHIQRTNHSGKPERKVAVTANGTTLHADHVIVTVSLGVLKQSLSIFQPALSPRKVEAITKTGFGTVSKLLFSFPAAFWNSLKEGPTFSGVGFIFTNQSIDIGDTEMLPWHRYVVYIGDVVTSPDTNVLYLGGHGSYLVDRLPDEQVLFDIQQLMQKFAGNVTVPRPTRLRRHPWSSDPSFLGAISYFSVDSVQADLSPADLAVPEWGFAKEDLDGSVAHSLLFAGEATHPTYYGTVHGAILSGQKEADRIRSYYYIDPSLISGGFTLWLSSSRFLTLIFVISTMVFTFSP